MGATRGVGTRKCLSCKGNLGLEGRSTPNRKALRRGSVTGGRHGSRSARTGGSGVALRGCVVAGVDGGNRSGGGLVSGAGHTYKAVPIHQPGRVLADLAVMIAAGGDALAHLATLRDQDKLFSAVASDATAWRVWTGSTRRTWGGCRRCARRRGSGTGPGRRAGHRPGRDDHGRTLGEGERRADVEEFLCTSPSFRSFLIDFGVSPGRGGFSGGVVCMT